MMNRYLESIETALRQYVQQQPLAPLLRESMAYSLLSGGKRVRPCLCLAVCETLGGSVQEALSLACALEMVHTYSLIHDDLPAMDSDTMRRGKPANHIRFGEGNGILAGDGLLTLAGCLLLEYEGDKRAAREIFRGAMDMASGQSLDLNVTAEDLPALHRLHEYKTGALFRAAVLSGARCAGEKEEELPRWESFARNVGLLFQITDDLLDEEKDIRDHKLTYVTLLGRRKAEEEAFAYAREALACLEGYDNPGADYLRELTCAMVNREK